MNFEVIKRDKFHWDVCRNGNREFAIRGEPGNFYIRDEREVKVMTTDIIFTTVSGCMSWICDEMMF